MKLDEEAFGSGKTIIDYVDMSLSYKIFILGCSTPLLCIWG